MKNPILQFDTSEHLTNLNLRACHPFARAVWMDLLCIMADCDPYGHLAIAPLRKQNKQVSTPEGLAYTGVLESAYDLPPNGSLEFSLSARLGYTQEQFSWSISQLEERHVFSRTADGIIFSRRMVRDAQAAKKTKRKS